MLLSSGRVIGQPTAPLRLVEFADFQCPFCARAAATLEKLLAEQKGQFAIEFHHFPLPSHPFAKDASMAAECAAEQGRFAEYYFSLYSHQQKVGRWSWSGFAKDAQVSNLAQFDLCVRSRRGMKKVDDDFSLAMSIGALGTPTWIVGDSVYGGLPPTFQIEEWIRNARTGNPATLSAHR
jgi:protein-disulfide isomerase